MDGMQPDQQNSYDFIMNPQQNKPAGPILGGPQKLLAIVGLFAVVTVIIIVLFSVVSSGGSTNRDNLVRVQANQIELARIIELGLDDVVDVKLKQQFQTLLTASTTDNQEIGALLAARDVEVLPLELKASFDSTVEGSFEEAQQKNDFDPVFEEEVAAAATQYLRALQNAASSAASSSEAAILSTAIENVQTVAQSGSSESSE